MKSNDARAWSSFRRAAAGSCCLVALLGAVAGCGGQPAPKKPPAPAVPRVPVPDRQAQVTHNEPEPEKPAAPAAPKEKVPVGAWMQFSVAGGEPFECRGFLKLHARAGTENVLEVANYDAPNHEEFPSLYVRARTSANSIAELVGQKLAASIHIQVDDSGHLIHNQLAQPLEIVITELSGKKVRGTFNGHAHDVALGGNGSITGKFQALLE